MITGVVTADREAVLELFLSAERGRKVEISAVIDTGFDGFLTLPRELIRRLSFPLLGRVQAALGDGSQTAMAGHAAKVIWDGKERDVLALQADGTPLVGMAMFLGHRLTLDVETHGFVGIQPLQAHQDSTPF